jgi:rod shape-determining protein MreC
VNKKKSGKIGIIITIIFLIILVFISNLKLNKFSYVENAFSNIIMPIQSGITYLKNKIQKNDQYFATIDSLKSENQKLKNRNTELEEALRQLEVIQAENTTLKEYLNLTKEYNNYTTVPAYIINKDISNYSNVFVINVGTDDGVKENMTVIAAEGLVGHIISVTKNTAKVQTIIDTSNVVSATLENSKDNVICRGTLNENELKATYISTDTVLNEDEKLHTSGMGGIYPKGIYIGKIKKINDTKNMTDRSFVVEAAVDFKKLETVLVITK